jgi:hypothetical protein
VELFLLRVGTVSSLPTFNPHPQEIRSWIENVYSSCSHPQPQFGSLEKNELIPSLFLYFIIKTVDKM